MSESGRHRSPADVAPDESGRRARLQLGPFEYLLLTLIALGIAVTIAMAVFHPAA